MIRRWLSKTPVLLTAYLSWKNRTRRQGWRYLSAALVIYGAWVAAVSMYLRTDRAAAISTFTWLERHALFSATICAMVAGMLVARRRALNQMAASRAWTAALPIQRSASRWQAIAVESVPVIVLVGVLAAVFGSLSLVALFDAGMQAPLATWAAATGGVVLGAGLGHLLPTARQDELYEGSRYVPHRRRTLTPIPTASLSALGVWPVRQMFASARPKTIARAMVPILLLVPMGATAADVVLAIGLLTAFAALAVLVAAVTSVSAKASRWLKPLPLGSGPLARSTLVPALAWILCATAIEAWLMWMLGSSVARSLATAVLTLIACTIFAVTGSLVAILVTRKGNNGRR